MDIFVVGPAGSGKSTFVKSFGDFLQVRGYGVARVNLDPATPSSFDLDIRNFIRTEDVMNDYGLGINGALLKSMELAESFADRLKAEEEFVIYDTPGQMELFIYSESGRRIVEKLSGSFSCAIFMMDSTMVCDAESFAAAILQNVIVSLRLSLPTLTVFTKCDVCSVEVDRLEDEIRRKGGTLAELLEKTLFFIEYTTIPYRAISISSRKKIGFEELLSAINELFCACGDIS